MFDRIRSIAAEAKTLAAVLEKHRASRGVLFYAEDDFSFVQLEGYVTEHLRGAAGPTTYVTSAADDPLLGGAPSGLEVVHLDKQIPELFRRIEGSAVVTTMPDLGQFHVPAPKKSTSVYVFHSLNSMHTSYRSGAFDQYDVVFCAGPHHVRELEGLVAHRGLTMPRVEEVGYYKLDRIAATHEQYRKSRQGETTVVVAPSWAPGNIFEAHGIEIVHQLLALGLRVVLRPHPQFYHSLYPEGRHAMGRLRKAFASADAVVFEDSITSEDSFHEADLMVSDWSGAAFEFALGTLRPVLFIDTPQKLFNPDWQSIDRPAFEDVNRNRVGAVVSLEDLKGVGQGAASLLDRAGEWQESLRELRSELVFNVGRSAIVGAERLRHLTMEGPGPSPVDL